MPPEYTEIKRGLALWLSPSWMIVLQLPAFPKESILGGKELQVQPRIGLVWQRVSGFFFFGYPRGDEL